MVAGRSIQVTVNLGSLHISPWAELGVLVGLVAAALVGGGPSSVSVTHGQAERNGPCLDGRLTRQPRPNRAPTAGSCESPPTTALAIQATLPHSKPASGAYTIVNFYFPIGPSAGLAVYSACTLRTAMWYLRRRDA